MNEIIPVNYQPAIIDADFPAMEKKLDELLKDFKGLSESDCETLDAKVAKSWRAELNNYSKELNDARIAIKKSYNAPLAEFETKVKELDARILEPRNLLDKVIKRREAYEKEERKSHLQEVYEDFAPALVPVVPFEMILDERWLNKSYGEKKAENALCDKVAGIAKDWETLKKSTLKFPGETQREFFRTLSLRSALDFDDRQAAEQAAINAMQAEVEEYHHENAAEPVSAPNYEEMGIHELTIPEQSFKASMEHFTSLIEQMHAINLFPEITYTISLEPSTTRTLEGNVQSLINHMKILGIHGSRKRIKEAQE